MRSVKGARLGVESLVRDVQAQDAKEDNPVEVKYVCDSESEA